MREDVTSVAAGIAAQGLHPFAPDQRRHDDRGERIGPPPSERRVEPEADEQDRREPRADLGLPALRRERAAREGSRDAALEVDERGHDDERQPGDDEAGDADVRGLLAYQA